MLKTRPELMRVHTKQIKIEKGGDCNEKKLLKSSKTADFSANQLTKNGIRKFFHGFR